MRVQVSESNLDQMNRSEAQRRYQNLIQYRIRPMLTDRGKSDADRVMIMKRICREANLIRSASGAVAGPGTREEIVDLLVPLLDKDRDTSDELRDWIGRAFRSFGAYYEGTDFE
jgi:hypothetical protein